MKRLFTLVFIVTLGIFFSCKQEVVEIYVSTDGNDQSSGGKGDPVKSLDKAREMRMVPIISRTRCFSMPDFQGLNITL